MCAQGKPEHVLRLPAGYPQGDLHPNAIESLNNVLRAAIKKRKLFPTDDSVRKVIYLAIKDASKKWSMPIQN
ncbi:hypothetical protein SES60163_12661 [Salmonella enterica subsp. salamae serovar 58:l,z13,z28:z6 str. 00-0163]|nr:hypothetical protein SES60163_12661 [Salmonella enterica subsp. salamae serovar 58:l,z13,z28:z6 str. 00-0163]